MNKNRFTLKQMSEALKKGAGISSAAAQILHCTPMTVRNYLKRYPQLQAQIDEAVEANLDLAESKLLNAIGNGQDWAVKFYLEFKGRSRGYNRRHEIAGVPGAPVMVTDARSWLADELDQMESRLRPEPGGTNGDARPDGEGEVPQATVH